MSVPEPHSVSVRSTYSTARLSWIQSSLCHLLLVCSCLGKLFNFPMLQSPIIISKMEIIIITTPCAGVNVLL